MTWSQSLGAATIYGPNNQGSKKIPLDKKEKGYERYFIVGCFDQRGYKSFVKVGKFVMAKPTSADICPEEDPNGKYYYFEKTDLNWEKVKHIYFFIFRNVITNQKKISRKNSK